MELQTPKNGVIGTDMPVRDAALKVTGQFKYVGDMTLPHMLHAKVLFSPVAHARIKSIDTSQAEQLEGVRAVVCWKNAPDALFNSCGEEIDGEKTERVFDSTVRYVGDKVAAVAAETAKIAEQALKLIRVEYEELPAVHSPREAILPDAPLVHRDGNLLAHKHIQRGNPAEAIAKAKYMLTERFSTPWTEHAFLEPECAVAYPDGKGVTVLSTDQGAYDTQHEIMGMLGLPAEQVRVRNCLVGGGFGGKEDVTVQHHAALIA